jgi:uncharacterized protein
VNTVALPRTPAPAPAYKRFSSAAGEHLLVVPHSRIYDLPEAMAAAVDWREPDISALIDTLGLTTAGEASLDLVPEPAPQSISLNVSSACNLSCSYCYAGRGSFDGAQPRPMTGEVARNAVDRLLSTADPGAPVTIGFLGGEPFANRPLIHELTAYAAGEGRRRGFDVRFSVTTNGTLLQGDDVALMRRHGFAVTVSIDGGPAIQNSQRPSRAGQGSFERLLAPVRLLLANPGPCKVAARATVTRQDLDVAARFCAIRSLGFRDVGFSPLRSVADGGALRDEDWPRYLDALKTVAATELAAARRGGAIVLANLAIGLKEIARGAAAPYPCGAGGGYFSVAADGRWYACHRAIGKPDYALGDNAALDSNKRREFLSGRHVHAQTECRSCWARYLCSGGCHQEAHARSPGSCDFIRGWLEFCLTAYCELLDSRPDYFGVGCNTSSENVP